MTETLLAVLNYNMDGVGDSRWIVYGTDPEKYVGDIANSIVPWVANLVEHDFLIVAFLNIGKFLGRHDGSTGEADPEFYTLPNAFVRQHHDATTSWEKVKLGKLATEIEPFKNHKGFEQIAQALGVVRPRKPAKVEVVEAEEWLPGNEPGQ